jgi:hypothetical protein
VQNYYAAPIKVEIALIAPSDWRIEPDVLTIEAPAQSKRARAFDISIPKDWTAPAPRFAIAADVRANGKYLGQITEAVVELRA